MKGFENEWVKLTLPQKLREGACEFTGCGADHIMAAMREAAAILEAREQIFFGLRKDDAVSGCYPIPPNKPTQD